MFQRLGCGSKGDHKDTYLYRCFVKTCFYNTGSTSLRCKKDHLLGSNSMTLSSTGFSASSTLQQSSATDASLFTRNLLATRLGEVCLQFKPLNNQKQEDRWSLGVQGQRWQRREQWHSLYRSLGVQGPYRHKVRIPFLSRKGRNGGMGGYWRRAKGKEPAEKDLPD